MPGFLIVSSYRTNPRPAFWFASKVPKPKPRDTQPALDEHLGAGGRENPFNLASIPPRNEKPRPEFGKATGAFKVLARDLPHGEGQRSLAATSMPEIRTIYWWGLRSGPLWHPISAVWIYPPSRSPV